MSQVDNTAQTLTVESAADEILNRMTATEEETENANETQEEETNEETQERDGQQEVEDSSDDSQEESSEETNESETEEPEAEEESTYETTSDLAEALDMPIDDFMANIKTKVKINGEELEVNLSDLKNGYQMESDYRRKTSDLAEHKKTFEQESAQKTEQLQASLMQVDTLLTNAEQDLVTEYNAVNWDDLRENDREEYLIKDSEFNKRNQKLQAQKQQASEKASEIYQEQQIKQQENLRNVISAEYSLMMDSIPEWNNEEVKKKDEAAISEFLLGRGFKQNEIHMQQDERGFIHHPGIIDHRVISIIRDAMSYRKQSEKVDLAKKRVKKLPKVLKSGAKQTKADIKSNKNSEAMKQFNKTGSRDDLVAALMAKSN